MMRCGIPSGRPLGFLVTAGSSPKKADEGAKGIFHVCLMWALSSVTCHKTSHRDVEVQGPEIPQPVPWDGFELWKVARSEVRDVSGEGQAEGVHPEGPSRRGHPSGKSRPERPDVVQGEGWPPVRSFREVGASGYFEVVHKDAEPVLWSFNVVRRKQGVPFGLRSTDGSRGLTDREISSGTIPGGRLAVKGEAFAEEVSLPSEWPSSSKQEGEVIVRPLKGRSPAKEGDMGVRVDEGPGVGKDSISSDRGAFIGRSEGIALRDCLGPEVVSEGKTQIGTSPGDGPSGGSSPLEEDAVSKGLFWMNDKTTWPAAEPRPGKVVGPKTGFDFPSGGPGRGSIRPVGSRPKDRPGIAPDHVRRRARQVRDEQGSSAQRDEAPGRAISERDIGPRATPKEPYPLRPAVRPSTPYKREAERAYERAFGIEGGGITAAPEDRTSGTQDLPAGDVRFLAAKIEEISARAARTDLPSGRIRVIFRTSVEGAGQVHVEVSREPTGAVAVFVRVQDQGLRDELLKASPQIRQALAEGGVQLARLEVEAEDHPVGWEGPIEDEGPSRRGYYHRFKRKSRRDREWTG